MPSTRKTVTDEAADWFSSQSHSNKPVLVWQVKLLLVTIQENQWNCDSIVRVTCKCVTQLQILQIWRSVSKWKPTKVWHFWEAVPLISWLLKRRSPTPQQQWKSIQDSQTLVVFEIGQPAKVRQLWNISAVRYLGIPETRVLELLQKSDYDPLLQNSRSGTSLPLLKYNKI